MNKVDIESKISMKNYFYFIILLYFISLFLSFLFLDKDKLHENLKRATHRLGLPLLKGRYELLLLLLLLSITNY